MWRYFRENGPNQRRLNSRRGNWVTVLFIICLYPCQGLAQDVELEDMICRDLGDMICLLEQISDKVGEQANSFAAKAPIPATRQQLMERTVIDLQGGRQVTKLSFSEDRWPSEAMLINLNPQINSWFLLRLQWQGGNVEWFHLENPEPNRQFFELSSDFKSGLIVKGTTSSGPGCELWSPDGIAQLRRARATNAPFVPLCDKQIYLRNKIDGYRTTKEWVVEFLRAKVWGGETITNIVKETVFKDSFLIQSEPKGATAKDILQSEAHDAPRIASLAPDFGTATVPTKDLGIAVQAPSEDTMEMGRWYKSKRQDGVFVSVIEPMAIDPKIMKSYRTYVRDLDDVELRAVSYLVAFDTSHFDLNFSVGTDHPAVGWSERVLPDVKVPIMRGPDGFDTLDPLTPTGLIPPYLAERVAGIFTGGFKRDHGAFRWGNLARQNLGSHYGFVEQGVILSTPQPGLATLIVYKDGQVDMKTWTDEDVTKLPTMRFVRQNGMPVIERDTEDRKQSVPGSLVSNWTLGNWSGSQDKKFRSLRAGVCLSNYQGKQFIIYGYFSSMTPAGMARVFQAYGCDYAMHLDMNALEHTYMTLYNSDKSADPTPQHLIRGMKVLDERFKGNVPRYIGYPDNRDFFYFVTKKPVNH